jgi:hypothetical protein
MATQPLVDAEPVLARELRAGDLFSTAGPSYWRQTPLGALGERVYIRTHEPCPAEQADELVYRLTIRRSEAR